MVIEQFMNMIYQAAINVIIGSDKRQLLPWDQWPVDKENGSATKGYKMGNFSSSYEMEHDDQHDVFDYLKSIIQVYKIH